MKKVVEILGRRQDSTKGDGRLAVSILSNASLTAEFSVISVESARNADILVYCRRSLDGLESAVKFCAARHVPLLLLTSGVDVDKIEATAFPLIFMPNASIRVMRFLHELSTLWNSKYKGWEVHIIEHHQASKVDISATALLITQILDSGKYSIESVRDYQTSKAQHNIPIKHRDGYAIHDVQFIHPDTKQKSKVISLALFGRNEYGNGVYAVCKAIVEHPNYFSAGAHTLADIVKDNIV